jgi:hypothetical protein
MASLVEETVKTMNFIGNWQIWWMDLVEGKEYEEEFEAILICTGMRKKCWRPPELRLEKKFRVELMGIPIKLIN